MRETTAMFGSIRIQDRQEECAIPYVYRVSFESRTDSSRRKRLTASTLHDARS